VPIECDLASCNAIEAWYAHGHHIIRAAGELPTPCYTVDIRRSPLRVEPPQFSVERCPTGGFCPEVITPFVLAELFDIGERREQIVVHHDGEAAKEIKVQELPADSDELAAVFGVSATSTDEATGFSKRLPYEGSWSDAFGEALADAFAKLSARAEYPDELVRISVVDSGVLVGGFAGFRHMYVSVRRNRR
jgi:hypothetical protein